MRGREGGVRKEGGVWVRKGKEFCIHVPMHMYTNMSSVGSQGNGTS